MGVFVGVFFTALVGTLVGVPGAEVPVLRVSVGSSNSCKDDSNDGSDEGSNEGSIEDMSDGSDDGATDGSDDGLSLGCLNIR